MSHQRPFDTGLDFSGLRLDRIESANRKARNVIRSAYSYRDKDYMKLKVIQACTPWMAQIQSWTATHGTVQ